MQLASTLGFILNKRSGKFLGLTPEEQAAMVFSVSYLEQQQKNGGEVNKNYTIWT